MNKIATFLSKDKSDSISLPIGDSMNLQDAYNKVANMQFASNVIVIKDPMESQNSSQNPAFQIGKHSSLDIMAKHNIPENKLVQLLTEGMEHEMEHTTNHEIAMRIAQDHIFENPNYYRRLKEAKLARGGMIQKKYANGGMIDVVLAKGGEIEKLEKKKSELESKLFDLRVKGNESFNKVGWGSGMRKVKIGGSSAIWKREDEVREKIKNIENQISTLKAKQSLEPAVVKSGSHRATEKLKRMGFPMVEIVSFKYGSGSAGSGYYIIPKDKLSQALSITGVTEAKKLRGTAEDWRRPFNTANYEPDSDENKLYVKFRDEYFGSSTKKLTAIRLMYANDRAFSAAGAQSGSEMRESGRMQEIYSGYMRNFMKENGATVGSLPKSIYEKLEDENYHYLNEWLTMTGYYAESALPDKKPAAKQKTRLELLAEKYANIDFDWDEEPAKMETPEDLSVIDDRDLSVDEKYAEIESIVKSLDVQNSAIAGLARSCVKNGSKNISVKNLFRIAIKIAELEGKDNILVEHIAEAFTYDSAIAVNEKDAFSVSVDNINGTLLYPNSNMVENVDRMKQLGLADSNYAYRKSQLLSISEKLKKVENPSYLSLISATVHKIESFYDYNYQSIDTEQYLKSWSNVVNSINPKSKTIDDKFLKELNKIIDKYLQY